MKEGKENVTVEQERERSLVSGKASRTRRAQVGGTGYGLQRQREKAGTLSGKDDTAKVLVAGTTWNIWGSGNTAGLEPRLQEKWWRWGGVQLRGTTARDSEFWAWRQRIGGWG